MTDPTGEQVSAYAKQLQNELPPAPNETAQAIANEFHAWLQKNQARRGYNIAAFAQDMVTEIAKILRKHGAR